MTRRLLLAALLFAPLAGCQSAGDLSLFGYSARPPFDPDIKTVYIPVFASTVLQTTPNRELERQITEALVKEINSRTPIRVVSDRGRADTELIGVLTKYEKLGLNRTQQNHVREAEIVVTVEVVWTDLRDGRVLSNARRPKANVQPAGVPFDPSAPPPPPAMVRETPTPVPITAVGRLVHELGESNLTANKMAADQLARQIVNMMESPW